MLLRTYECIVTHIHHRKICFCSTVRFFVLMLGPTRLASQHTACLLSRPIREQHLQVLIVWEAGGRSWLPALPHVGPLDSPTRRLCSAICIRGGGRGSGGTCCQAFLIITWQQSDPNDRCAACVLSLRRIALAFQANQPQCLLILHFASITAQDERRRPLLLQLSKR